MWESAVWRQGAKAEDDPDRFRRPTLAALKPLADPTEPTVDAAHQAIWPDALWSINNERDFGKTGQAMRLAAMG